MPSLFVCRSRFVVPQSFQLYHHFHTFDNGWLLCFDDCGEYMMTKLFLEANGVFAQDFWIECSSLEPRRKEMIFEPRFGWAKLPGCPYWPVKVIKRESEFQEVYVESDDAILRVKSRDFVPYCEADFKTKKDNGIAALKRRKKHLCLEACISDTEWMQNEVKHENETEKPASQLSDPTRLLTEDPTLLSKEDPTVVPTEHPNQLLMEDPTLPPTEKPNQLPTENPKQLPTENPKQLPKGDPFLLPTEEPNLPPTGDPNQLPTEDPNIRPTGDPNQLPTEDPTLLQTEDPNQLPTEDPTLLQTEDPNQLPTEDPTLLQTEDPNQLPTEDPTLLQTEDPNQLPTEDPTLLPTEDPTLLPTEDITLPPTGDLNQLPTEDPNLPPTGDPNQLATEDSTLLPTYAPCEDFVPDSCSEDDCTSSIFDFDGSSFIATKLQDTRDESFERLIVDKWGETSDDDMEKVDQRDESFDDTDRDPDFVPEARDLTEPDSEEEQGESLEDIVNSVLGENTFDLDKLFITESNICSMCQQ